MAGSRPSHIAWVVQDAPEGSDAKPIFREVGAPWPHRWGNGFTLQIHDQFSISGRIVITERKEREPDQPQQQPAQSRRGTRSEPGGRS
jgi:hypothetical protein